MQTKQRHFQPVFEVGLTEKSDIAKVSAINMNSAELSRFSVHLNLLRDQILVLFKKIF